MSEEKREPNNKEIKDILEKLFIKLDVIQAEIILIHKKLKIFEEIIELFKKHDK